MTTRTKLLCCLAAVLFLAVALPAVTSPKAFGVLAASGAAMGIAGTVASFSSATFSWDKLVISLDDGLSRKGTLLSGQGALTRGTVLGKILIGAAAVANNGAGAGGANTGNGVFTIDAATPTLSGAQVGKYTVMCITAVADGGVFRVTDPKGHVLGDVAVGATFANQIKFAIADGVADFVVGDGFSVTIAAGSGKYKKSAAAATDGSEEPDVILAEDCDATGADAEALLYCRGTFNDAAITLGAGHTVASITEGLRKKGIDLVKVV